MKKILIILLLINSVATAQVFKPELIAIKLEPDTFKLEPDTLIVDKCIHVFNDSLVVNRSNGVSVCAVYHADGICSADVMRFCSKCKASDLFIYFRQRIKQKWQ